MPAANYHLTLAFIGEVTPGELDLLREIGASQRAAALTLALDRCVHAGPRGRGRCVRISRWRGRFRKPLCRKKCRR
ncbi:MAG TPA: 2'-5' RNA ligase family protein [Steroidobacteraceae bacterium]|nr:2'-5' RNA ligase family protein [Steroidobacteraceae bacterium]